MAAAARVGFRLSAVIAAFFLVGCYSLKPTGGTVPKPGTAVGFDINDAGRVALGGSMGPAIEQIEGRLVEANSTEYVVSVTGVHLMNGAGDQVWHGETVHISTAHVAAIYERKFSTGRSVALGSAAVGAVVAIATRSLVGLGSTERPVIPQDTGTTQRRPRR